MATVIQRGYYQYTHKECKSLIQFELSELVEYTTTDYTGDTDIYRSLVCPACGNRMLFPAYGDPIK